MALQQLEVLVPDLSTMASDAAQFALQHGSALLLDDANNFS
eukprot:gene15447-32659_t